MTLTLGSICSGYGGLELGIADVLPVKVAWVADHEPATPKQPKPKQGPSIILAHRFPGVPNLGDITTVDWATTAPVQVICGGTPCQDVSPAGARKGMRAGTRSGIWSSMVEAIAHHRPAIVVWENVRGVLSAAADSNVEPCPLCMGDERECSLRALGRVLGDLAELGYDAVWCGLPASAVGAPHGRYRVFVLAWASQDADGSAGDQRRLAAPGQAAPGWARAHPGGPDRATAAADADHPGSQGSQPAGRRNVSDRRAVADTQSDGRHEWWPEPERQLRGSDAALGGAGPAVPDPVGSGRDGRAPQSLGQPLGRTAAAGPGAGPATDTRCLDGHGRPATIGAGPGDRRTSGESERPAAATVVEWGDFGPAVHRWERILGRPAPAPTELSTRGSQALSPRFVEWMMGLQAGWVTDVPGLTRNDQLKALGNGVVPQQTSAAVGYLLRFVPTSVQGALFEMEAS